MTDQKTKEARKEWLRNQYHAKNNKLLEKLRADIAKVDRED